MHSFKLADICTFPKLNPKKIAKMAQNRTPISLYMHFFMGGKIARIRAVVRGEIQNSIASVQNHFSLLDGGYTAKTIFLELTQVRLLAG